MKLTSLKLALLTFAALQTLPAQGPASELEFGALGLISSYNSVAVEGPAGAGKVGPGLGFSGGMALGQSLGRRWGGELRYLYFQNDLKLKSGGQEATLKGAAHAIHYDVLYYFSDLDSRVRPYVAGGFGVKRYEGRGTEDPFQPLGDLALLTKTSQVKPAADFGFGVKFRVTKRAIFRVEFRDYISGTPNEVIAAAPGAKIDKLLHQWAPLVGVTWTW